VAARRNPDFVLIARTDAYGVEGIEGTIRRAQAYVEAGADAIFPEGLSSEKDFETVRAALGSTPLLANMTEFGRTPLFSVQQFSDWGYQMVIFPVSALRVTLFAVECFYQDLLAQGTQAEWMERMMTRADLYKLVNYEEYERSDAAWRDLR
jgi:methylisocitrate lyase